MTAIRNMCVARATVPPTTSTGMYQVPGGFGFLLKSLVVATTATTPTTVRLWLNAGDGSALVYWDQMSVSAGAPVNVQTWIAMNAGDGAGIVTSDAQVTYWLSGAVLPYAPGL